MSYLSAPLATNTAVIGGGAVHVWVRSSTPDVDLQAAITEVRPDGTESFVGAAIETSMREPPGTTAQESTGSSQSMPSRVILPVVPGVSVPTGAPPCRACGTSRAAELKLR